MSRFVQSPRLQRETVSEARRKHAEGVDSEQNTNSYKLFFTCSLIATEPLPLLGSDLLNMNNAHFRWSADGTQIIGISPSGRTTVISLKLNNEIILVARRLWVSVGWFPPED